MDEDIIIKKDATQLIRKRLKEMLKPLGFQPHPKTKTILVRIREEMIDVIALRTVGYHLEPCFLMYYRRAPFADVHVDLVNGSLSRFMKKQEDISTNLWWDGEFPNATVKNYYYKTGHFEKVWQEVKLALESYILPYMDSISVEKLLSLMVKYSTQDEDFFQADQRVFFRDKYFACMGQAAVYGVGMWIAGKYADGLPYIVFAQNKYREWMRPHEQEPEPFYQCHRRTLEVMDTLIDIYERTPEELETTVKDLSDQIAINWVDYMI